MEAGMVKTVSAAQANREFSKLMQIAEAGEEVVVTSRGKPKVKIVRADDTDSEMERRQKAFDELTRRLNSQTAQNLPRATRDDMYD
ncbi:type II toxin-antitoxin system prevent-host-death family antitoxin [Bosea sp. 685]|uniref:type II toxin-antitoxin system Phd/YefM family antitoxin n=1 Tax=Bosea sp. 685 TaxID=3080057 RepID=UPI0028934709|nr:type II toxin-antitoxin system prevent-host-death family antitoxin [Bosea sp. 685]WNJ90447.1 type II toxin-antitoxin system prevent-host-death family antitoxin [Bosea sp. 685]